MSINRSSLALHKTLNNVRASGWEIAIIWLVLTQSNKFLELNVRDICVLKSYSDVQGRAIDATGARVTI